MTAEEADDFVSEYGTGVTPMQVYNQDRDDRADAACAAGNHDYDHGRCTWCMKCEPETGETT